MKAMFGLNRFVKKSFVIHTMLFAVFPIVFLYAHNISEMSIDQILMPLGASLALALVLWALLVALHKNGAKAGLATSVFVFLFFTYGRFYDLLERWDFFVPRHGHLLPGMLLFFGYCVYLIKVARRDFMTTTRILNIVAVVLIAINLFSIATYQIRVALSSADPPIMAGHGAQAPLDPDTLKTMPDIYFIILDEYAHPDTMAKYYNYDNGKFTRNLEEMGFFIAHKSETPSKDTACVIASVLNMEHIEGPKEIHYQKIANNRVVDFLRSKGYKYVYLGGGYNLGRYKIEADLYYDYYEKIGDSSFVTEFSQILLRTTMLRPFQWNLSGFESFHRRGVTYSLEHLKRMPGVEGPKFVFAHVMCPHEPFLFGPGGEDVNPANFSNYRDKRYYLGQYIFISREISKVAKVILKESIVEPIIMIQSDHGLRPHHRGIEIGRNEWRKILNAYHLPGEGKKLLHDSISPLNSFRLIFNHYFGASHKLINDSKERVGHDR